jgi:O-antigen biosynthesis protein
MSALLSRGNLPLSILRREGPSAVGWIDLESSLEVHPADGRPFRADHRDLLLLVRRGGDPLALLHVEGPPTELGEGDLADAVSHLALLPESPGGVGAATPDRSSAAVIVSTIGADPDQLGHCIDSLLAMDSERFEILVVDNRPGGDSVRRVVDMPERQDPRLRYVTEPIPGLSVARNRGLMETRAELVAFTDDDVVVDRDWLTRLLDPFSDPRVSVGCGMVLPLELETPAQKGFERYLGFSKGLECRVHDLRSGRAAGIPFYPFLADAFGTGNSMAFRREELIAAGGFDPALGAGSPARAGEETDVFSRTILGGRRIVYEPRALSWHRHRREHGALREQIFGYGVGVGALTAKAFSSDRRFYPAAARGFGSLLAARLGGSATPPSRRDEGAPDLLRARREGIAQGPLRYLEGRIAARGLALPATRAPTPELVGSTR